MQLAPIPKQFMDHSGVPYRDGTVEVFINGEPERAILYDNAEGTAQAENPSVLDSHGSWNAFVDPNIPLDYIVKDKYGNVIFAYENVVAGLIEEVVHNSTLVGTGKLSRPLGINPSLIEGIREEISRESEARQSADRTLGEAIESHVSRTDNPHGVTAHQVGAYTQQETEDRINDADAEIIESLDDETTARRINDELLQEQINEVAVQTDWNQDDSTAMDYLKNRPSTISDLEIEALFI